MSMANKRFSRGSATKQKHFYKKNKKFSENSEIQSITQKYKEVDYDNCGLFSEFPLSRSMLSGLKLSGYTEPTDIQRQAIGQALQGLDVLGAAKTGSGKTLAFVIPVLECLWRNRWSKFDGMGALIISPTRELASQTFSVLREIGKKHDFSAALLTGGNDLDYEKTRLANTNIVVGTPGRILQHLDENPLFQCQNLQILVLDEADRILDMGFEKQINAVVENLPTDRQTLLFSATQTKSVKSLARLSLKNPVYISVHEHATQSTPEQLEQSYTVCEEHDKIKLLWSFLKHHRRKKILVFLTSCKQVRYVHEVFRRLRPGVSVLCLHGAMKQTKRTDAYEQFCNKQHAALFATDIAARGLDFPNVDWVLHLDCPCDALEYIHRSGRTARYKSAGHSLLVLTQSQCQPMLQLLEKNKMILNHIDINPKKMADVTGAIEAECVQDSNLKYFAQQCLNSYLRSVLLMRNKEVFNVRSIEVEKLAKSLGLSSAPRIRFLQKQGISVKKTPDKPTTSKKVSDDVLTLRKSDVFNVGTDGQKEEEAEPVPMWKASSSMDALLADSVKKRTKLTKAAMAKLARRKQVRLNEKIVFDEQQEAQEVAEESAIFVTDAKNSSGLDIEEAKLSMIEADKTDRETHRSILRSMRQERKRKAKLAREERKAQKRRKTDDVEVSLGTEETQSNSGGESGEGEEADTLDHQEQLAMALLQSK